MTRRSLSREEARLWAAVAGTVRAMPGKSAPLIVEAAAAATPPKKAPKAVRSGPLSNPVVRSPAPVSKRPIDTQTLDATWERKLAKALVHPDFTLDLHGHSLDGAHARLDAGLAQASMMGARLVLVITGRPRPVESADRSHSRGAIRAKVIDWLALGAHGSRIAAVRPAHRRHGGAGALYVVLRRPK